MPNCLHIRSGRFHLLVDAVTVLEVIELDESFSETSNSAIHGCRLWRGASIRSADLRQMLGEDTDKVPLVALVCSTENDETPVMLVFDQIFGLVQAEERDFRPMPQLDCQASCFFDKVLPDKTTGMMLLRLKTSLSGLLQKFSE